MASRNAPSTSRGRTTTRSGARQRSLTHKQIEKLVLESDSDPESETEAEPQRYTDDLDELYAPEEAANYSDSADSDDEPPPKEPLRLKSKSEPGLYLCVIYRNFSCNVWIKY